MKIGWFALMISMLLDVLACLLSKQLEGLRRPLLLGVVVVCYMSSMALFAYCMKVLPIGPAFAIWSGLGLALIAVSAIPLYGQTIDAAGVIGIGLIMTGTIILSTLSKMEIH
jgi:multidrug transporter EmrE-like cation transporter